MKKSLLFFFLLLSISWVSKAQNMVLEFTTTAAGQSISLPLFDDGVTAINCEVNWGDLTPNTTVTTGALTPHTFTSVGTYQVQISGTLPKFGNGSTEWAGVLYLKKVMSFGSVGLTSLGGAFNNADNLTEVPATLPATITNLSNAFYKCGKASITNLNLWDVSHVTTMGNMFQEATAFNQYIGDWNTSSLTTMGMMFYGCSAFNQNINTKVVNEGLPTEYIAWDVSQVTHLGWVFTSCLVFNQDIGNWNTSNVTGAMYGMFNKARAFNKDISTKTVTLGDTTYTAWDVSGVTDMNNMLKDANAFNQNIGNWDVGNVTNMSRMFINASVFNQNIGSWDVSNVTNMSEMFSAAPLFNQNIANWDVSSVTNMSSMFNGAIAFEQNLGGWDISQVTNMTNMFLGVTLTSLNYNALLNGWAALTLQNNVVFNAGTSKYSPLAEAARATLTTTYNWTITDGGMVSGLPMMLEYTTTGASQIVRLYLIGTVNCDVDWGDGSTNSYTTTGPKSHTYTAAGTYTVEISGTLTQFGSSYSNTSNQYLRKVITFGNTGLTSLKAAFVMAHNLTEVPASLPSTVTSLEATFYASNFASVSNLDLWDVSHVTNMNETFNGCVNFNQNISGWNTGNVESMWAMFSEDAAFNQPIGIWNVSKVIEMASMFGYCTAFNQSLSAWDVSSVTNLAGMFVYATAFNQDISNWNVSHVEYFNEMFYHAEGFNQNIGSWVVSSATTMENMFFNAVTFNQDISSWNVGNVTNMAGMFNGATSFNQDISNWNVASVTTMADMFNGVTLTTPVYDAILNDWSALSVQPNVVFNGGNSKYSSAASAARTSLISSDTWTITDGGYLPDPMKLVFVTSADDQEVGLPLDGTVNVTVKWGDGNSNDYTTAGIKTHTFATAGTYTVEIGGSATTSGTLTVFGGQDGIPNYDLLTSVIDFGEIGLTSLYKAFNLAFALTDVPASLPATVTNLSQAFINAASFNDADIAGWNVGNVTNMSGMFQGAYDFNQNIGSWNVGSVTNMSNMFNGLVSFNQNIGSWNVNNVTNMAGMFMDCHAFNQPIASWNVSAVTDMSMMFYAASTFNQDLSTWNIAQVTAMNDMFEGVTLSKPNYDAILNGWAAQTVQPNVVFNAGNSQYTASAVAARSTLTSAPNSWTITDGGQYLPMILEFTTTAAGQSISLPLFSDGVTPINAVVIWDDGTSNSTVTTGALTPHTYTDAGTYQVEISGTLPKFGNTDTEWAGVQYLNKVLSFGSVGLTSLGGAFYNADNLTEVPAALPATVTDLSFSFAICDWVSLTNLNLWDVGNVTKMNDMFSVALSFNQDIGGWDVSQVTNMAAMFNEAASFNQNIGGWTTTSLTEMWYMFYAASAFNQNIGGWDVSHVTNMEGVFNEATSFNGDIGAWDVSNVTDMSYMFSGASSFNQDIGNWNLSAVTKTASMFQNATSFNQDISTKTLTVGGNTYTAWDVSAVTSMTSMFRTATSFNQNIGNWNVSAVTSMTNIFNGATSFNQNIGSWNVGAVTSMSNMFYGATSFNQNIGSWNVGSVKYMTGMFSGATAFDQNPGTWNVTSVLYMSNMFLGVTLSISNYDALLIGWAAQAVKPTISFHGGNSQYSSAAVTARNTLDVAPNNWTITDGGQTQPMILEFTTTAAGQAISLPLFGTVDCYINWDDGNLETVLTAGLKYHTYASAGTYQVEISGNLTHFGNSSIPGIEYLDKVLSFGDIGLISLESAFCDADNLMEVPATLPADVTNLNAAFLNCDWASLTNLNSWDVSHVTLMSEMFSGCVSFNQNISAWNVSGVTNMAGMFMDCHAFNQPIASWSVSAVTDMSMMFYSASSFNQDLSTWNIAQVTAMNDMFEFVTLSKPNYDAILIGWAAQTVQSNVVFNAGSSQYTSAAVAARSTLTSAPNSWTITDGGLYEPFKTLTLSDIMLQGLYAGSNTMNEAYDENGIHWAEGIADHITVELHDAAAYSTIIYTASDVVLSTSGDAEISIPSEYLGSYYITIKHRNSIETVSANPVSFSTGEISQSFANPANVYGNNLIEMIDGTYCIFGGDVNQDGNVNLLDIESVNTQLIAGEIGYINQDTDGNGSIQLLDREIVSTNVLSGVIVTTP
ncbi:MAG: BspA family leucine-rich repeat surface protein [Bacteroidales bacterium]|nr:BspA family leucine-rich repeat surface protein [Bacteroidales bacterium]